MSQSQGMADLVRAELAVALQPPRTDAQKSLEERRADELEISYLQHRAVDLIEELRRPGRALRRVPVRLDQTEPERNGSGSGFRGQRCEGELRCGPDESVLPPAQERRLCR